MTAEITFSLSPAEFLRQIGWQFKPRGKWLSLKICPFCDGGRSGDQNTFIVHAADGNFSCSRSKCGTSGNFWKLIESQGMNPRDFLADGAKPKKSKQRKKFVYGK